jgi:L-asparaginase
MLACRISRHSTLSRHSHIDHLEYFHHEGARMPRHIFSIALLGLAMAATAAEVQPPPVASPKNIRVLATGGTIAGAGEASSAHYRAGVVPIGDVLAAVPGLAGIANISAEQVANVGSYDIDEAIWRRLLARLQAAAADPGISGVVITHGTDTLEETAYFLSLTTASVKPIVLVGAMRASTATSADGPQNLMDAVRVASSDEARNRGVLVVMNDTIFDAAAVTKLDSGRVNAFGAPSRGPIGEVLTDRPRFFSGAGAQDAAFPVGSEALPRVAIAYAYAGIQGDDIRAAAAGAKGVVIAGVGSGAFSASARQAVRDLTSKGIPVIRTARQGAGDVAVAPASMGDQSDEASQTIAGRELTPAKARILLMLALQAPRSREELQSLFDRYGTGGR